MGVDESSRVGSAKQEIERTAFRIFHESGIEAATYSAISEASGFGRPLVQYHFPKKNDLVLRFARRFMSELHTALEKSDFSEKDPEAYPIRLVQLYYAYLLGSEGMRTWSLDVLARRELTSRLVVLSNRWALPFVTDEWDVRLIRDASTISTGGIYEYIFVELSEGRVPDPNQLPVHAYAAFLSMTDNRLYDESVASLTARLLPDDEVARLIAVADERLASYNTSRA